ncbi:MAG: hypothetical protein Q7V62_03690 [Actinomycetota bacterium]|nr:hypothetical protein [Actinomycetota bacterium]
MHADAQHDFVEPIAQHLSGGWSADAGWDAYDEWYNLICELCFPGAFDHDCPELGWLQPHKAAARRRERGQLLLAQLHKVLPVRVLLAHVASFVTQAVSQREPL